MRRKTTILRNRLRSRKPSGKRSRLGTQAAEFAFVAPVVFLVTFASFEFMRVTLIQSAADVASYEACREVMVPGAKIAEAEAEAEKYLNYMGSRDVDVRIRPRDSNDAIQSEINDFTSNVEVRIQVPVNSNVLLLRSFFGDQVIEATTSLTFESYSGFYDGSSN